MKNETKPTQEEKEQYFASHWGQEIQTYKLSYSWRRNVKVYGSAMGFITLTDLADITDDATIECAKFGFTFLDCTGFEIKVIREGSKVFVAALGDNTLLVKIEITNPFKLNIYQIDFLRSIGIALPWRGYTVEQLISFGWLKIRQKGGSDE